MIRSVPTRPVIEAVETVLSIPAEAALEPTESATDVDDGDGIGVTVQRARFDGVPKEPTEGQLLVSVNVPYEQLPSSKPVIPDDDAHDGSLYEMPPGTSPAHLDDEALEPTPLSELGPEHEWFVEELRDVLDAFPVVDAEDMGLTCIGYDGDAAYFGGEAEIELGDADPAREVPERLRTPGTAD